jgi:ketosteroid isomerase-like protein
MCIAAPSRPSRDTESVPSANIERLREAYSAYNRERARGILGYLDPEVEWRNPADSPIAGVFVGHEGVLEWQRQVDEVFEDMHFEPERIEELPDGRSLAFVRFRFRVPTSETETEVPFAHLVTWRDGKATEFTMYTNQAAAREAAGLAP